MDKLYFGDILLMDFSTFIKSNSINGITFVDSDPGYTEDGIIYLISVYDSSSSSRKLYLRYYGDLYEIGTKVTSIPTNE